MSEARFAARPGFGDAFNDFQVPYHLTTREFNSLVARHLKPNGLYLMNVIDGVHNDFLRSSVRTLRETFPSVGVIAPTGDWPPRPKDRITYVLVAAPSPPFASLPIVPRMSSRPSCGAARASCSPTTTRRSTSSSPRRGARR